uniref:Uncharacterized protein n=1 Tax=Anguilla anguilla TaxID=7936 RepID=A0A0E9XUV8_ANGAN
MTVHSFPVSFKEFNPLIKAIPNGLIQLVKSHLSFGENKIIHPRLVLDRIDLLDKKCTNTHIRDIFQGKSNYSQGKVLLEVTNYGHKLESGMVDTIQILHCKQS